MDLLHHTDGPWVVTDVSRSAVDLEVIVPAFDEEDRLDGTLRALVGALSALPWSSRIVVVDNGSTDQTAEVADRWAARFPVRVIGCSRQGKGAAVRRGFLTSPARWVGYCDAGGAALASLLAPAVELLAAGRPIVVGARVQAQPLRRAHVLRRRSVGELSDIGCGFKFFHAGLARRLAAQSHLTGPAFDRELLTLAHSAEVPVTELAVQWRDLHGATLRTVRGRLRNYRELLALRLLGAEPVDALTVDPSLVSDRSNV